MSWPTACRFCLGCRRRHRVAPQHRVLAIIRLSRSKVARERRSSEIRYRPLALARNRGLRALNHHTGSMVKPWSRQVSLRAGGCITRTRAKRSNSLALVKAPTTYDAFGSRNMSYVANLPVTKPLVSECDEPTYRLASPLPVRNSLA